MRQPLDSIHDKDEDTLSQQQQSCTKTTTERRSASPLGSFYLSEDKELAWQVLIEVLTNWSGMQYSSYDQVYEVHIKYHLRNPTNPSELHGVEISTQLNDLPPNATHKHNDKTTYQLLMQCNKGDAYAFAHFHLALFRRYNQRASKTGQLFALPPAGLLPPRPPTNPYHHQPCDPFETRRRGRTGGKRYMNFAQAAAKPPERTALAVPAGTYDSVAVAAATYYYYNHFPPLGAVRPGPCTSPGPRVGGQGWHSHHGGVSRAQQFGRGAQGQNFWHRGRPPHWNQHSGYHYSRNTWNGHTGTKFRGALSASSSSTAQGPAAGGGAPPGGIFAGKPILPGPGSEATSEGGTSDAKSCTTTSTIMASSAGSSSAMSTTSGSSPTSTAQQRDSSPEDTPPLPMKKPGFPLMRKLGPSREGRLLQPLSTSQNSRTKILPAPRVAGASPGAKEANSDE